MKSVIYITKNQVWFDGRAYDWGWDTLSGIFQSLKRDNKIDDARIVLGSSVSYIVNFKVDDISKTKREEVFRRSKGWFPFTLTDNCFDWKIYTLSESDFWVQVIAVEPAVLEALTEAIKKSKIKVDWIVPVGVVLGEESMGKEVPVLIKWRDKEELSVLAQNGLVDYVGKDSDELVSNYAKQKWHLEVNPEQIVLRGENYDFTKAVLEGKNRGSDENILGFNLLKKNTGINETASESVSEPVAEKSSGVSKWLLVVAGISVVVMLFVLWWRFGVPAEEAVVETPSVAETEITPSPTPVITEELRDLSLYDVQVLNGSGVNGRALEISERLTDIGFSGIDIGNNPTLEEKTLVSYKADLPGEVLSAALDTIKDFEIGNVLFLTNEVEYDLVIVMGSSIKNELPE